MKTGKLKIMTGMFSECYKLKDLNITSFDTKNVYDMSGVFYGCSSLKKINLKNFNTCNVKK